MINFQAWPDLVKMPRLGITASDCRPEVARWTVHLLISAALPPPVAPADTGCQSEVVGRRPIGDGLVTRRDGAGDASSVAICRSFCTCRFSSHGRTDPCSCS